jgi:hypothetical protein
VLPQSKAEVFGAAGQALHEIINAELYRSMELPVCGFQKFLRPIAR